MKSDLPNSRNSDMQADNCLGQKVYKATNDLKILDWTEFFEQKLIEKKLYLAKQVALFVNDYLKLGVI